MRHNEMLRTYPLFTGLTRPAMYMGVTLQFFVLALFPALIAYILLGALLPAALFFTLLYLFGIFACRIEERIFEILIGRLQLNCRNHHYWGCHSYDAN